MRSPACAGHASQSGLGLFPGVPKAGIFVTQAIPETVAGLWALSSSLEKKEVGTLFGEDYFLVGPLNN